MISIYPERNLEGTKATDLILAAIAVGTASRGGLSKLSIRGSNSVHGVTSYGLSVIRHSCRSLKKLLLFNISTIDDNGLIEIAKGCPLLEMLEFAQCPNLTDKGLVAIAYKCRKLTSLNFDSCFGMGNRSLQSFGRYSHKLQSVAITNCPLIGDQGVRGLFLSATNVLTNLKLQSLNITDSSIAVISKFGIALNCLVLSGLQNITQIGFGFIGSSRCLQSLTSVTINLCNGLTNSSLEAVGKGCPNLKQMTLYKSNFLSDYGLVAFAIAARYLQSLHLVECHRITQIGLISALSHWICNLKLIFIIRCLGFNDSPLNFQTSLNSCQSLQSLTIHSSPGFTSASLSLLGKVCARLHNLDLTGLAVITDEALISFLETAPQRLVSVKLAGCVNLTDKSIVVMAKLHGSTLGVINLDGCKNITDESLHAMADDCYNINELHVSRCSITDTGLCDQIDALCDQIHASFQVLSISGCSMISYKSVHYIKMLCHTLKTLNIKNCMSLGKKGEEELKRELRECDVIY